MASTDATPLPIKNQAYRITIPLFDKTGALVTGAAGLDSEISKDGGTFTDCTNEATEIATSSGIYYLDLTSTEMNADTVAIIVKTSTTDAKTTPIVMYPAENTDIPVNVKAINGTSQTGRDIGASVLLSPGTGTGQVDITSGVVKANATQWLGGTIPAVNVTGVPLVDLKYTLGTISPATAGSVRADAVTGAVGSVTGAVGSVTGAVASVTGNVGGNVTGSVGSVVGAVGSVTGNVGGNVTGTVASVVGNVGGSTASVVGAVGSVTGNVGGNVVGTVASVVGAVGSVTGNVGGNVTGSVGSLATQAKLDVNTEADTALSDYGALKPTTAGRTLDVSATGEAGVDLANVGSATTTLNLSGTTISTTQAVASVSGAVGSVTGAVGSVTGNVGGNVTGSIGSVATGGITAASIAADAIGASELAADAIAEIQSGLSTVTAAQVRAEMDSNSTKLANLDATVSSRLASGSYTAPDNTSVTAIKTQTDKLNFTGTDVKATLDGETVAVGSMGADTITASAIATDAFGSLELAAGAASEIATAVVGAVPTVAQIRAEIDANSTKLDVAVSTRLATVGYTAPPTPPTANAIALEVDTVLSGTHGGGDWDAASEVTAPTVEEIGDYLDSSSNLALIGSGRITVVSPVTPSGNVNFYAGYDMAGGLVLRFTEPETGDTWPADLTGATAHMVINSGTTKLKINGTIPTPTGSSKVIQFAPTRTETAVFTANLPQSFYDLYVVLGGLEIPLVVQGSLNMKKRLQAPS